LGVVGVIAEVQVTLKGQVRNAASARVLRLVAVVEVEPALERVAPLDVRQVDRHVLRPVDRHALRPVDVQVTGIPLAPGDGALLNGPSGQ
jgi:hypothetical protein